ncbi:MAG: hydrogenase nickel incorporation protein HypB [Acidobacteriota bacterium]|nr:hydrogenase nickel incorporation protein HypB [Acidobacteriota bacterium]
MCDDCGCGDTDKVSVEIHESLLAGNAAQAAHNREHFAARGMLALNLMGSPGSGKTALLEATARALQAGGSAHRLAALSGDLATDHDGARLRAAGIPAATITTGSACHLDARLVHHALHHLDLGEADTLAIENVGNLVCPAIYDLGEAAAVVALSVTEGEDKPLKYPTMFNRADLVLLTKVDLLPHLPGFRMAVLEDAFARTMPRLKVIRVSATTGEGLPEWIAWLEEQRAAAPRSAKASPGHAHGHHEHPAAAHSH